MKEVLEVTVEPLVLRAAPVITAQLISHPSTTRTGGNVVTGGRSRRRSPAGGNPETQRLPRAQRALAADLQHFNGLSGKSTGNVAG